MQMSSPREDRRVLMRWRLAVFAIFFASGLSIATWASRVPTIKEALDVDRSTIGMMLLAGGIASILGLSLASLVLTRFGARRGMLAMMIVFAVGVALIGIGADVAHSVALTTVGLLFWGFGNGCLDIMMNVEAAAIEKRVNKTLLPLFHAFFSFGTVAGAGLGVAALALNASATTHLSLVCVLIVIIAVVSFLNVPRRSDDPAAVGEASSGSWRDRMRVTLSAWREPRTYALGVVMLGMAFAEGGANDWMPLAVVEGHGASDILGAAALATFSTAMTATRIVAGPIVDRFGRVPSLRLLAAAATAGLLLFIFAPNLPVLFIGAALWGAGVSLGFPLGMSAAADDPKKAAARVSAAATIGYIAFLAGPPILGVISESIGLLNTLLILVVLVAASGLFSSAAKPIGESETR